MRLLFIRALKTAAAQLPEFYGTPGKLNNPTNYNTSLRVALAPTNKIFVIGMNDGADKIRYSTERYGF
jgi:hypothetical protein